MTNLILQGIPDPPRASNQLLVLLNLSQQVLQVVVELDSLAPATTARRLGIGKGNAGSSILSSGREKQRMRRLVVAIIPPRSKEPRGSHPRRRNDYMTVRLLKLRLVAIRLLLWLLPL
jgi:hypothetical protein